LQPTDEYKCQYLLTTVGDLGELALKEIDVVIEVISWPHLDGEEVVTTPLGFLASSVLCEEDPVTSEKLWRELGGREWNHSDVAPLTLEGKVRHMC